jgi:hypothetical protein
MSEPLHRVMNNPLLAQFLPHSTIAHLIEGCPFDSHRQECMAVCCWRRIVGGASSRPAGPAAACHQWLSWRWFDSTASQRKRQGYGGTPSSRVPDRSGKIGRRPASGGEAARRLVEVARCGGEDRCWCDDVRRRVVELAFRD